MVARLSETGIARRKFELQVPLVSIRRNWELTNIVQCMKWIFVKANLHGTVMFFSNFETDAVRASANLRTGYHQDEICDLLHLSCFQIIFTMENFSLYDMNTTIK